MTRRPPASKLKGQRAISRIRIKNQTRSAWKVLIFSLALLLIIAPQATAIEPRHSVDPNDPTASLPNPGSPEIPPLDEHEIPDESSEGDGLVLPEASDHSDLSDTLPDSSTSPENTIESNASDIPRVPDHPNSPSGAMGKLIGKAPPPSLSNASKAPDVSLQFIPETNMFAIRQQGNRDVAPVLFGSFATRASYHLTPDDPKVEVPFYETRYYEPAGQGIQSSRTHPVQELDADPIAPIVTPETSITAQATTNHEYAATPAALWIITAATSSFLLLIVTALYHLLRSRDLLDNKVRARICEIIREKHGASTAEISRSVGIKHQTASYHLDLLEKAGYVIAQNAGKIRVYFVNGSGHSDQIRAMLVATKNPVALRILQFVRTAGSAIKKEVSAAMGVTPNAITWHVQKLTAAGLLSEVRLHGQCILHANEANTQELEKLLVNEKYAAPGPGMANG